MFDDVQALFVRSFVAFFVQFGQGPNIYTHTHTHTHSKRTTSKPTFNSKWKARRIENIKTNFGLSASTNVAVAAAGVRMANTCGD